MWCAQCRQAPLLGRALRRDAVGGFERSVLPILTVVFSVEELQPNLPMDKNRSIDLDSRRNHAGPISLENQKRNFLTVLLPENTVTQKRFLCFSNCLYDQETIEWE